MLQKPNTDFQGSSMHRVQSATKAPLFSVIIACHNHEEFVSEAVVSALSQRHPTMEIIAVDDGSRDNTAHILDSFGESIITASLPENRGAGAARNHGASLASGEFLVFLDGDDVLMPWALDVYEQLVASCKPRMILGRCTKCVGAIPQRKAEDIPQQVEFVAYPDFLSKDRPWVYNSSSFVVRRSDFLSAGGWSTDIFYQDIQDLLNKLGIAGNTALVLEPATVWYRMHSTNAVRRVTPFVDGLFLLLTKTKNGAYPGGVQDQTRRNAWLGGLIFYWGKEALHTGHYRHARALFVQGWWRVLWAILRRSFARITGRRATQTLPLHLNLRGNF